MESLQEGLLVGIGNPLLDISAIVSADLLTKYKMKPDDAIMAAEEHMPLYQELVDNYKVEYIAGGSVQNSLRVAQWFLEKPRVCTYFGCVARDNYADILKERASAEGVNVQYQYTEQSGKVTGTCAVLITGNHRSLCARLSAADCFTEDHLNTPHNQQLIQAAKYFYASGFFLAVSPASILRLAHYSLSNNHTMLMNLSAPFVSQFYKEPLMEVMPYVDILFGNEMEMSTFSKEMNLGVESMGDIALKICNLPKQNEKRPRIVIVTQGCDPVLLVHSGNIQEIPVTPLDQDKIVDTNGAGDAFAGGFLAQLVLQRSLEECVKCGIYAASQIIQSSGCTFTGKPNFSS